MHKNIDWKQFEVCNCGREQSAFEDMCRRLFVRSFFGKKKLFHSNPNNVGIEIEPLLHEETGKRMSFQAKFISSSSTGNLYRQFAKSASMTVKHYTDNLDIVYLYCNKNLSNKSKGYAYIEKILSEANIETVLINNQTILDEINNYHEIASEFFGERVYHKVGIFDLEKKVLLQESEAMDISGWKPYILLNNDLRLLCQKLTDKISAIHLPTRSDAELLSEAQMRKEDWMKRINSRNYQKYLTPAAKAKSSGNSKAILEQPASGNPFLYPNAEIDIITKENILCSAKLFLNKHLNNDFFSLGSLQIDRPTRLLFQDGGLHGTTDEKLKFNLIHDLNKKFLELSALEKLAKSLGDNCIIPLAISNCGHLSDKNITVNLSFDETEANAVFLEKIHLHGDNAKDQEDIIHSAAFIVKLFELPCDENIEMEYTPPPYPYRPMLQFSLDGRGYDTSGSFGHDLYQHIAAPITLSGYEFDIRTLRAGESKWLDNILLLKPNNFPIVINYRIKSEQSYELHGEITITNKKAEG